MALKATIITVRGGGANVSSPKFLHSILSSVSNFVAINKELKEYLAQNLN